jgi:hypothetical protein
VAYLTRRRVLNNVMRAAGVAVALPLFDYFLDGNGTALARGAPIPTRFGTWFWGCGINEARWVPDRDGRNYDFKAELKPLEPLRDKLTVLSGFNAILNGQPNLPHWTGIMSTFTGTAPTTGGPGGGVAVQSTLDTLIADAIGKNSRFRSIELACTGNPSVSYSMQAGATVNPSEVDPVNFYRRIFGPGYTDPNAATFTPDPAVMLRRSVLSSVTDERADLMRTLGAADRARADQYFTSLREVERQLGQMLEKPEPLEACVLPQEPGAIPLGPTWEVAGKTHDVLAELLVMALACNQTRVFNMALSNAAANLRRADSAVAFHELTHEEPVDEKLGYQPKSTFFMEQSMKTLASLLEKMAAVKEGDGTLLDHSLVFATSESNFAKLHTLDSLPIIIAGSAGGKWKSGQHVRGRGDPVSRVGLTVQQVLGLPTGSWGTGALQTSKTIGEVVA